VIRFDGIGAEKKYVLIVAAVIVGVVLTMLVLTIFTHIFANHERAGQFDIYTNPKSLIPPSTRLCITNGIA
jgi:hypothetical protein